ncbi:MAG: hypothetical protein WC792_01725 [Candidatus Micrarchaeia archaeon]
MQITEKTGGRITARESNSSYALGFALPLLFIGAGGGAAYYTIIAPSQKFEWQIQLIGPLFVLAGFWVAFKNKRTSITLDKSAGKAVVSNEGLVGQDRNELPLSEITAVEAAERVVRSNDPKRGTTTQTYYDLNFVRGGFNRQRVFTTQDETLISLNPFSKPASLAQLEEVGQEFASFLGVPFERRRAPTLDEALGAISTGITTGMQGARTQ